jgi:hypothetical protein
MRSRFASVSTSSGSTAADVLVRLFGLLHVAELLFEGLGEPLAEHALDFLVLGVEAEHVGVRVGELLPAAVDPGRHAGPLRPRARRAGTP